MEAEDKIVMYDSPEAARKVTMHLDGKEIAQGWLSADNFFYTEEDMARYKSCTHKVCECGNAMKKQYVCCESCRAKRERERYLNMPFQEWNGKDFICSYNHDAFFWSEEELIDYCDEHEVDANSLMLCICEPNEFRQVDSSYWEGSFPEDSDGELPKEMEDALRYLNVAIMNAAPPSWRKGKFRTSYDYTPETTTP